MTIGHKQPKPKTECYIYTTWISKSLFRWCLTNKAINIDDINARISVDVLNRNLYMITIFCIIRKLCLYHPRNGFKWNRTNKNIWMKNINTTIKVRISIWNVEALEGRIIFYVYIYKVCKTYFVLVEKIS